jgi:putative addiction module CopG family antidote
MPSDNLNVRVTGKLRAFVNQQIGPDGFYENASEYVRDLIRRDLESRTQSWEWLKAQLEPGLRADASEFVSASADDVIRRNRK